MGHVNRDTESDEEAALFARALLMPKHFVEVAVETYRKSNEHTKTYDSIVEYISHIFGVSKRMAHERLLELKLI